MRIIISPAKKMNVDADSLPVQGTPQFLQETETLLSQLKTTSYADLKKLWKCNDSITELNFDRVQHMDLARAFTPAILAYEGIQYQYMAPGVFTYEEFDYIQQHLRILSGFYGVLRPFDGVMPYRLEMQAKLAVEGKKDLYSFWGDKIAQNICAETDCIINLASKEYSVAVSKYLPQNVKFITCVFGEENNGKIIEKGTACKMARGEMVRFMAENNIINAEDIKAFDRQNYRFAPEYSDDNTFVFVAEK